MRDNRFMFAGKRAVDQDDAFSRKTAWKESMHLFLANKGTIIGLVFILLMLFLAVFGPYFNAYTYDALDTARQNLPPRIPGLEKLGFFDGTIHGKNAYEGTQFAGCYFWFGTDALGRDLFTRFCHGMRVSLIIAFLCAVINMVIGVTYGMVSGYVGGRLDVVMQRIIEILNGIPELVVVTLLMIIFKPGLGTIVVAMAITGWLGMSRLVRAQTLKLRELEYVMAARTLGAKTPMILFKHIFPNLFGTVIVMGMMAIPNAIYMESFLSFIGLGIPAPQASLGSLISFGYKTMLLYPYQLAIPAVFFALLMISLNLVGDGLRDAFDPKQQRV